MEVHSKSREKISCAAHCGQETVGAPGPVTDDRIDEARYRQAVEEITHKSRAANHCARSDGGASIREGKLEKPECEERHSSSLIGSRGAVEEEPIHPNEPVTMTKHKRKTESVKKKSTKAGVHNAFHQHVYGLARAAETSFKHGEANLHTENEKGRNQRPNGGDGIHYVVAL